MSKGKYWKYKKHIKKVPKKDRRAEAISRLNGSLSVSLKSALDAIEIIEEDNGITIIIK